MVMVPGYIPGLGSWSVCLDCSSCNDPGVSKKKYDNVFWLTVFDGELEM